MKEHLINYYILKNKYKYLIQISPLILAAFSFLALSCNYFFTFVCKFFQWFIEALLVVPFVLYGQSIQPLQLMGHPGLGEAHKGGPTQQEVRTVAPVEVREHDPDAPTAAQLCISASHLFPQNQKNKNK